MMRKWRGLFFTVAVLFFPIRGNAQQSPPAKTVVLKAAWLFDGKSDALVSPGIVVVTNGKIASVGARANLPADATVIDLGQATLLPGFMDAHTHLTDTFTDDWKQDALKRLQETVAERALDSTVNARKTLLAGFTTVRDVGSSDYLDVGLRNAKSSAPGC